jgi:hypothetical protein
MVAGAQVFLCYARDDWGRVVEIYSWLESRGFRPWVDKKSINPGDDWRKKIGSAIRSSHYFLVLLTKNSVNKRGYLQREIKEALELQDELPEAGRYAIPVRLEFCRIPDRLAHIQSADLFEPDGRQKLLSILGEEEPKTGPGEKPTIPRKVERLEALAIGGVRLPCFFPSISAAAKNALSPLEHLQIVVGFGFPQFLVSAFDFGTSSKEDREKLRRILKGAANKGQVILMDSGLYERKWLRAPEWNKPKFHRVLKSTTCHMAFCFDDPDPPTGVAKLSSQVIKAVADDRSQCAFDAVMPIVHSKKPEVLAVVCKRVAESAGSALIAVPERELGDSISECAVTIALIRQALNELGRYVPLHLLGTGNPLSILIYAWAGADSFDGLDWCQTAADRTTGRLYHSLQLDFLENQTEYAGDVEISYMTRLLAHNLECYRQWMTMVQEHLGAGTLESKMADLLPEGYFERLRKKVGATNK